MRSVSVPEMGMTLVVRYPWYPGGMECGSRPLRRWLSPTHVPAVVFLGSWPISVPIADNGTCNT